MERVIGYWNKDVPHLGRPFVAVLASTQYRVEQVPEGGGDPYLGVCYDAFPEAGLGNMLKYTKEECLRICEGLNNLWEAGLLTNDGIQTSPEFFHNYMKIFLPEWYIKYARGFHSKKEQ